MTRAEADMERTGSKPLAVGIEDYKRIIDKSYYYVDKTLFIKELLDRGGYVNLFTRPRRFGKTLALSMIRTFFELEIDRDGRKIDNRRYFDGMKILNAGKRYTDRLGQYPVIFLSLKSAKQPVFQMAYESLLDEIIKEYVRHRYVLNGSGLVEAYKKRYLEIMDRKADAAAYAKALAFLTECLKQYHNTNTVVLLDEYDVPLENAYIRGFYGEMADFIRSLFESVLKTNDALEFAVITGCLRISKESIFTGLNNPKVISILDRSYAEYFGFTQREVDAMLAEYGLTKKREEIRKWYDGYLFGDVEVYNPWSVCCYTDDMRENPCAFPKPYWSNTSANQIVRELVENADGAAKRELEELIAGGAIEKPVHEEITYEDIHSSQDNLWNFLFFTGYLKADSRRFENNALSLTMKIPNTEVGYIYRNMIRDWFDKKLKTAELSGLYQAVLSGDGAGFEELIKRLLRESISFYDSAELFYHGFLLGLLSTMKDYEVVSNRESREGRPDIILKPYDEHKAAVILELKWVKKYAQMEQACDRALNQIEEKKYDAELLDEGYRNILKYGISFCKKSCMVKKAGEARTGNFTNH